MSLSQQSYGGEDQGENDPDSVTVSKSLTDLANLPLPPQKKAIAAVGWDDDGFDDWNFEDVEKE